jgi:hypothetical protein
MRTLSNPEDFPRAPTPESKMTDDEKVLKKSVEEWEKKYEEWKETFKNNSEKVVFFLFFSHFKN